MNYIVVLNWNGEFDTIQCLESLFNLNSNDFNIVVCDNDSMIESYNEIDSWLNINSVSYGFDYVRLGSDEWSKYKKEHRSSVFLLKTGSNLGYAGGNNVGIKFSINQNDFSGVWILNNDTEVASNSLNEIIEQLKISNAGICGSKLIYYYDKNKIQGLGGCYNNWLGTTYHYGDGMSIDSVYECKNVLKNIDYIIGASFFITKDTLDKVGFFAEEYFLYFEELDYIQRAKDKGVPFTVALDSIVYHKEGASTSKLDNDKKPLSDYIEIRSRLLFAKKFNRKRYFFVKATLLIILFNRLKRGKFKNFFLISKLIYSYNRKGW